MKTYKCIARLLAVCRIARDGTLANREHAVPHPCSLSPFDAEEGRGVPAITRLYGFGQVTNH
jgi:hypothetical protein